MDSRLHLRLRCCGFFAGLLFCLALPLGAQPTNVLVVPPPDWTRETDWKLTAPESRNDKSDGTRYLLYEMQERPRQAAEFRRVILLMENEAGVQDSGSLRFSFDPSFQQLHVHRIVIHRGGAKLNRLDPGKVRLVQREPELWNHVLTGRQTAVVLVEDLRVGDALEYAYSIHGGNPILAGHFAGRFVIQSSVPVERQLFRLVWDGGSPLFRRTHRCDAPADIETAADRTTYSWTFTNATAIPYEDDQPPDFEPYAYLEFSDYADWSAVVNWALPLYAPSTNPVPADLAALIARWKSDGRTAGEQARLALEFVQDELRYTGIELGPDSYRPADPAETFLKRFGDCKGKVALLCRMLRELDITARPALVNTAVRDAIAQRLPSPFAFNHVIVKLELEGKTVWLDPTRSHQGGTLWQRFLPPYGQALVIESGGGSLEDIPPAPPESGSQQRVTVRLTMKTYEAPVPFIVRTEYRGASADYMREELARTDPAKLAQDYLNYYARSYPGIRTNGNLRITDERLKNLLVTEESYVITNLWEEDPEDKLLKVSFYAENIANCLTDPNTRLRQTPLHFSHPQFRQQETIVQLPDADWNIPALDKKVEHEAFTFQHRRKLTGSTLKLSYECRTKVASLPPEKVPDYLARLADMKALLDDTLQRPGERGQSLVARLNWVMVLIAAFGLGGTGLGVGWYWRRLRQRATPTDVPPPLPAAGDGALTGLGGWLVLVGIGLSLGLLLRVVNVGWHWDSYFSIHVWQAVAMPRGDDYHPLFGPLLIFELLGNTAVSGVNVLALLLFFGRRTAFPRLYIVLLLSNVLFLLLDDIAGTQIPFLRANNRAFAFEESGRAILHAAIWIAYMLKSRRVRLTFTR